MLIWYLWLKLFSHDTNCLTNFTYFSTAVISVNNIKNPSSVIIFYFELSIKPNFDINVITGSMWKNKSLKQSPLLIIQYGIFKGFGLR